MKTKYYLVCTSMALLLASTIMPLSVSAEDETAFVGTVTDIQGQHLGITLEDGRKIMVIPEESAPEDAVGQRVTGWYTPLGDTYLLINPSFNEK